MRTRLSNIFSGVLIAGGIGLLAGSWWNPFLPPPIEQVVRLSPAQIVFDQVPYASYASEWVTVENTGSLPLDFKWRSDCGCTNVTPHSGSLRPGESQPVRVDYRPQGLSEGILALQETLLDCDILVGKRAVTIPVTVAAHVFKPFVVDPQTLVLDVEALAVGDFSINFSMTTSDTSLELIATPDFLSDISIRHIPDFDVFSLTGKIEPQMASGSFLQTLVVSVRSDGESAIQGQVSVPLTLNVHAPFKVLGSPVDIEGHEPSRLSIVSSEHISALRIVSAKVDVTGMDTKIQGDSEVLLQRASTSIEIAGELDTGYLTLQIDCESSLGRGQFQFNSPITFH